MARIRRKQVLLACGAVALAAAVAAWQTYRLSDIPHIGAGYTAQQTCACLFVSGRKLDACLTDLDPLARRLISVQVGENEVTASGLHLTTATARYEKAFGCSLRD